MPTVGVRPSVRSVVGSDTWDGAVEGVMRVTGEIKGLSQSIFVTEFGAS
ncbi:hypothetical protein [Mycobacterium sp. NPDC006124]